MKSFSQRFFRGITRNILAISLVSLFNDIASEMIYPIVPIFLTTVLHAPVTVLGLIEGIAEATANLLRVFSGAFSDKLRRRKPFMIAGYALSTLSKLVIAASGHWSWVLGGRFLDRFGKGIRTSARDALLTDSSEKKFRGRVFGFHRALDTIGALIGPVTALVLLKVFEDNLRLIFYLATVPAIVGIVLLIVFVRERHDGGSAKSAPWKLRNMALSKDFKVFLLVSTIFAIGNSSDAFIILRAYNLGLSVGATILAYALFNFVYAAFSFPAGIVSDRLGQKRVLLWGFGIFALLYFLFGIVAKPLFLWFLFPLYGVYMALTEGVGKAYISVHADKEFTGTTYGIYQTLTGICALPASLLAGFLWRYLGPGAPFIFGGITAAIAFIIFGMAKEENKE